MNLQALVDEMNAQWQRERAETQMTLGKLISSLWKVLLISICYARFVSATMRNSSRCRPVNMRGHHRVAEMIFAYRYTYDRRQS